MTAFGIGHPDWQAYSNWRDSFIYSGIVNVPPGGNIEFGDFVTTNWAALIVHVEAFSPGLELEIEWYADVAQTQDVDTDFINATVNTDVSLIVPCKGNLAVISFFNPNGTTVAGVLSVQPTNYVTTKFTYLSSPQITNQLGATLAHSTSATIFPNRVVGGPATLVFNPHDTTGKLNMSLSVVDATNTTFARPVSLVAPTTMQTLNMNLPGEPLRMDITNTDTVAAHVYDVTLTQLTQ